MNTPEATGIQSGLDSLYTGPEAGVQPASSVVNHEAVFSSSGPAIDHEDRDAFGLRLQQHYHQYAVNDTPFLLIAMRGDGEAARGLDFSLLYECVLKLLTDQNDWLVDIENRRLIVLLPLSLSHEAQRFFARLRIRLLDTVPNQAETYLYAISAITIANGTPFQTAEEFLTVALEEV